MSDIQKPIFILFDGEEFPIRLFESPLEQEDGMPDGPWLSMNDVHQAGHYPEYTWRHIADKAYEVMESEALSKYASRKIITERGLEIIIPFNFAEALMKNAEDCGFVDESVPMIFVLSFWDGWGELFKGDCPLSFEKVKALTAKRWTVIDALFYEDTFPQDIN